MVIYLIIIMFFIIIIIFYVCYVQLHRMYEITRKIHYGPYMDGPYNRILSDGEDISEDCEDCDTWNIEDDNEDDAMYIILQSILQE